MNAHCMIYKLNHSAQYRKVLGKNVKFDLQIYNHVMNISKHSRIAWYTFCQWFLKSFKWSCFQFCHTKTKNWSQNLEGIPLFRIQCATSVPLGKGTKFALHHGKMSTKRRAIQILHISMFQFTFKCRYNNFISKYTDINSLHVTQINLLHNDTFCST